MDDSGPGRRGTEIGRSCGDSGFCLGLSWSRDGKFLAVSDKSTSGTSLGLYRISPESGEKRKPNFAAQRILRRFLSGFLADGKTLAFDRAPLTEVTQSICCLSDSGEAQGEARRLTPDQPWIGGWTGVRTAGASYSRQGNREAQICRDPCFGGTPEPLVGGENATDVSTSRISNQLVYARSSSDSNIWRFPGPNALNKSSAPTRLIASTQPDLEPQFSPDGKKIVFSSLRSGNLRSGYVTGTVSMRWN